MHSDFSLNCYFCMDLFSSFGFRSNEHYQFFFLTFADSIGLVRSNPFFELGVLKEKSERI